MNSFLLFSNELRPKLAAANPELTNAAVSVLLGERWKALPAAERAVYVEAAKKIKEDFKLEHPEYRYARTSRAAKGKKRKQDAMPISQPPPPPPLSEALSLHALALAGASLASPRPDEGGPRGCFPAVTPRGAASPNLTATASVANSSRPLSRASSLSMLDQLCVVADGVQRA